MYYKTKSILPPALVVVLLVMLALFTQTSKVQAWAWSTHHFIVTEAEDVFSDGSFFSDYHSTLQTWCVKPDQGWGERDWHWLDIESIDPLKTRGGRLPWAMENIFNNAVWELKNGNWQQAAELMGAMSHFTADATMPLHATFDYNPGGNHVNYEHVVDSHLDEIPIPEYVPQELDNVFDATMTILYESFDLTDEDPAGGVNLSDFLENDILWNDTIQRITENRLRASVQFTANLWYTTMIQAGLTIHAPTLEEPENGASVTTSKPTFTWSSVNGTVSYDFQLALDNGFTSNVATIKGLSTSSYTLDDQLTCDNWYWRVRSGDNSTHVGLWSQTQKFIVDTSVTTPGGEEGGGLPLIYLSVGISVIIIIAIVVVVVTRR